MPRNPFKWFKTFNAWPWRDQVVLGLIIIAVELCNMAWIRMETRPPHWDMAYHLSNSLSYLTTFKGGHLKALLMQYNYYPPLLYLLTIVPYLLFGASAAVAVSANVVFITVLVFSTYGIGRSLYDRRTGLLAALFVITAPMMVTQFKEFQLDAPLTAMVALSVYLLIKSDNFRHRWFTILLGISLGMGMLTKWTFPFIIGLPLLTAVAVASLNSRRNKNYSWIFNLAFAALLAYAIASPWYITNMHQLHLDLVKNGISQGALEGDPAVGSLASNLYYANDLMNFQLYLLPLLLFVAGLVILARKRVLLMQAAIPLALIIGTIGVFTLLPNKDARYTLPILPALAVVAVAWIERLNGRWRSVSAKLVVLYCLIAFWVISFGSKVLPKDIDFNLAGKPVEVFAQHGYIIGAPSHENWHQEELFRVIKATPCISKTLAYSGPDTIWFNNMALNYYGRLYGVEMVTLDKATFLAVREGGTNTAWPGFKTIKHWQLPDKTTLTLYQKP